MKRLFWRECREQAWFAIAAFLSPALAALISSIARGNVGFGMEMGAVSLTFVLFAAWGAWVVARERDRGRSELSFLPVPPAQLWLVRVIPGLVTPVPTGAFAYLLSYERSLSTFSRTTAAGRLPALSSITIISTMLMLVFLVSFLCTLALRGAGPQLRTLIVRRWVIGATVVITGTIVGAWLLVYQQVFDAQTTFGPTPTAVLAATLAGNDSSRKPVVNDEMRIAEIHRVSEEITAPDNVQKAIMYLANAPAIKAKLEVVSRKPLYATVGHLDYGIIAQSVRDAQAQMSADDVRSVNNAVPAEVWADIVYLDAEINESNLSRDFLRPARISDTITDLISNVDAFAMNSDNAVLTVRNHDPRLAEIFANAITASYKAGYHIRHRRVAQATLDYYTARHQIAQTRLIQAQSQLDAFKRTHRDVFLPEQVSLAVRALDATRVEIESARSNLADIDAQMAAKKARLLGEAIEKKPGLEDQITILAERRKGIVARLAELNSIAAQKAKLVDTLPEITTSSQVLSANAAAAAAQYKEASKRLSIAQEDLIQVEANGSLVVQHWAGTNSSASHPEAPAREGATKRNWTVFWTAIMLSLFGSSAVVLGAAFLGSGRTDGDGGAQVGRSGNATGIDF